VASSFAVFSEEVFQFASLVGLKAPDPNVASPFHRLSPLPVIFRVMLNGRVRAILLAFQDYIGSGETARPAAYRTMRNLYQFGFVGS
jgi:hypothetical protein